MVKLIDFPPGTEEFLARVAEEIPLSRHLGVQRLQHEEDTLQIDFALAPNLNVHGTAFAGSLYAACVLSGWSLATRLLMDLRGRPEVVVRDGQIRYRRPVEGDFRVCCSAADPADLTRYRARAGQGELARIDLVAEIGAPGALQVRFQGSYVCLPG